MVELRQGLRLAGEATQEVRVLGQVFPQHFDGDLSHATPIVSQIDIGHAPAANEFQDFVAVADGGSFSHDRFLLE